MFVELINPKRKQKVSHDPRDDSHKEPEYFLTFSVVIRGDDKELIMVLKGCMYNGYVSPPRRRIPGSTGYYTNVAEFGRPLFKAIHEQLMERKWWTKFKGIPHPVPPELYYDAGEVRAQVDLATDKT